MKQPIIIVMHVSHGNGQGEELVSRSSPAAVLDYVVKLEKDKKVLNIFIVRADATTKMLFVKFHDGRVHLMDADSEIVA